MVEGGDFLILTPMHFTPISSNFESSQFSMETKQGNPDTWGREEKLEKKKKKQILQEPLAEREKAWAFLGEAA